MQRKLAIKRLTASDLTFFEWHFRHQSTGGNQKAINLNANIFIDNLYPDLPDYIQTQTENKLPLDILIYGPGGENQYNLQRKIVKGNTYKNWRLNGEFVANPDESPERFNILKPGDFVIFDFDGIGFPVSAKIIFVAKEHPKDKSLHTEIESFLGTEKMKSMTDNEIQQILISSNIVLEHPINQLVLDDDLEDFVQGGDKGLKNLLSKPYARIVSSATLKKVKEAAEANGRRGEEFINAYLTRKKNEGEITDFFWQSNYNPISVYDFSVTLANGETVFIDVKSTARDFQMPFHISLGELRLMATSEKQYDIYRVFAMNEDSAKLRIVKNVKKFAMEILEVFKKLPEGICPDSVSVENSSLIFEEEIKIQIDEIDEE